MTTLYCPDLIYLKEQFQAGLGLLAGNDGRIAAIGPAAAFTADRVVPLKGRALLPGFVNAHSHSFQRLIRGMSESRVTSGKDFWSWRGTMYHAALRLSLEDIYDVARMAFLEMLLSGTTTVGEFHYLHNAPDGRPYEDPNAAAKQVIAAARSVGLRIVLLRSAYLRSGYQVSADPGQVRFFEEAHSFLSSMDALLDEMSLPGNETVHLGVAPHSIRAVPLAGLQKIAARTDNKQLVLHMHVSEQVAENEACVREYGMTPIKLLAREKVLNGRLTAVHAIHITDEEVDLIADAQATICSCPTTERNLGDGILHADRAMSKGISICLGSDSQAQIAPLEDARELDYHLRLAQQQRAVLDQIDGRGLAARLMDCAARNGARSLAIEAGELKTGALADFITIDLHDPSIAGHDPQDLLPMLVFSLERSAIQDVAVHGRLVLEQRRHPVQDEIVRRYVALHQRVWHAREVRR